MVGEMDENQALRAVAELTREKPEWLPVLEAALIVAERCERYGGEFAGTWVLQELKRQSGHPIWLPNLRVLISYGLLEKAGESTRGGRRAYYRCVDRTVIGRALAQVRPANDLAKPEPRPPTARFRFVGAGNSGVEGSDTARRAGDMPYEPRSWR